MINEQLISKIEFTRDICVKVTDQVDANSVFNYLHFKEEPLGYQDHSFRIDVWDNIAYIRYYKGSEHWAVSKTPYDCKVITFKEFKWIIWDEHLIPQLEQLDKVFGKSE